MNSDSGTYALVLSSDESVDLSVGRCGAVRIEPGFYIYIGSAFGPGGVKARVLRHCRQEKARHWHIDYLREHVEPVGAWFLHGKIRLEHTWAKSVMRKPGVTAIAGFGSSDCKCSSHLFYMNRKPSAAFFFKALGNQVEFWSV